MKMTTISHAKVEVATFAHDLSSIQNGKQHQQPITTAINYNKTNNLQNTTDNITSKSQLPSALSTITILRRHPMYDSLVLVKKFNSTLNKFTLEFPTTFTSLQSTNCQSNNNSDNKDYCTTKLVSVYLDGDDPIYQCNESNPTLRSGNEMVYVPMNGLMSRLENYENMGISIDSRAYAFAIGLKTAERHMTSSSMKELQESPPQ